MDGLDWMDWMDWILLRSLVQLEHLVVLKKWEFLLFSPIFIVGNKAILIEVESESDIFPEDEGQSWQI